MRHNIRNNLELIEGLKKLKIKSNDKLIPLDVTNMLGKIPKKPLLELLRFDSHHGHPEGLKYAKMVEGIMDQTGSTNRKRPCHRITYLTNIG